MTNPFENAEVIYSYTRAQALDDGVLVDVSSVAKELGIKHPVAVTTGVWNECVEIPRGVVGQDQRGRLWDVLWMFKIAATKNLKTDRVTFAVHVRKDNRERMPPLVSLWALCGPGDTPDPVITIMLEGED